MAKTMHPVTAARLHRGFTQTELAARAGMTQVGVSHVETGVSKRPHRKTQAALAHALGYSEQELFHPACLPAELGALMASRRNGPVRHARRLSTAQRKALIRAHGWSTEPEEQYGWASEADWNLSYARQDPAAWAPLVIDGQRERPPRWFLARVRAAREMAAKRGAVARSAGSSRATARSRRRRTGRATSKRGAPPGDPDLDRPASGHSTKRRGHK